MRDWSYERTHAIIGWQVAIPKTRFRIKANHGNETPSHIAVIHCVSSQATLPTGEVNKAAPHEFQRCYAIASRRKKLEWYGYSDAWFDTPEKLWEWLRSRSRPREPLWVFSYNAHLQMQLCHFWHELDTGRFRLTMPARTVVDARGRERVIRQWNGMLAIDDRPFVVFAVSNAGTLKVVDVKNYYDVEPADLKVGIGQQKHALNIRKNGVIEDDRTCEIFVDALARLMTQTITGWARENRGNWQPTIARMALSNYRHEYIADTPISIDPQLIDRPFERSAFYGGEIQHWYKGLYDRHVYKVDVNSLYPSVMHTGLYPCGIRIVAPQGSSLGRAMPCFPDTCIARVRVYCRGDLPVRTDDRKVTYPVGYYWTNLAGPELQYAHRQNVISMVDGWCQYEMAPLFIRYVAYWWAVRSQAKECGDVATAMLAKGMLNSLYGKFAQRRSRWELLPSFMPPVRWGNFVSALDNGGGFCKLRAVAGVTQRQTGLEEKEDTFPAIAAFVTAEARMYMRHVRSLLPEKSVLTQSTDAFLLTENGYDKIRETTYYGPQTLGAFRLVTDYQWIDIRHANGYLCDGEGKVSGLPSECTEGTPGHWDTYSERTTAGLVAEGLTNNVPVRRGTFVLLPGRTSREYGPDGWAYV